MKKPVIALNMHPGGILISETKERVNFRLPKGCFGICFVFESKKTAREFWGKDAKLLRIERIKK